MIVDVDTLSPCCNFTVTTAATAAAPSQPAGRYLRHMNIEQDRLETQLQSHISSVGLQGFRRQALKGLKLKTVIKVLRCITEHITSVSRATCRAATTVSATEAPGKIQITCI
jgi:hypothetical protein